MRRMHGTVLAVAAALVLAGCGDGDGDRQAAPATDSSAAPVTTARLKSALLTAADLPAGYTREPSTSPGPENTSKSDNPACAKAFEGFEKDGEQAPEASAEFTAGDTGPFLLQSVTWLDGDAAKQGVAAFRTALAKCDAWTETGTDGAKTMFTLAPMPFARLGDDTHAMRMTIRTPGPALAANFLIVRVGHSLCMLVHTAFPSVAAVETEALARKATAKLARLDR